MKKFLSLVLLVVIGLFATLELNASDSIIWDGDTYEVNDMDTIAFEFLLESNRLLVIPSNTIYLSNGDSFANLTLTRMNQFITDTSIDIQSQSTGIEHVYRVEFEINNIDGNIDDSFTHLVIEYYSETYYHKLIDGVSQITMGFDIVYVLEYDEVEEENYLNDYYLYNIYIDSVMVVDSDLFGDVSPLKIYLIDLYPSHDNFYSGSLGRDYWVGYDSTSTDVFTTNYLFDYFVNHVGAYANSDSDLSDLLDNFIDEWSLTGLTLTLESNFEIGLFSPIWYDDSIDPWYEVYEPITTINLKIPSLSYEGTPDIDETNFGITEIWGSQIVYTIDGDPYSFYFDESETDQAPRFSFYISTVGHLVTFNTNGGSLVSSQYVALGSSPSTPTRPIRSGFEFRGWTLVSTIDPELPWNSATEYEYGISEFIITSDTTFYAIWRESRVLITMTTNGGTRRDHPNFVSNRIYTVYGDSASENTIDLDMDESYYRIGFAFLGWYQDEALTTPFNVNTPLTANITIYAKWVASDVGQESPSRLNQFLDDLGLLNFPTLFFIYLVFVITMVLIGSRFNLPTIVYVIFNILLSVVWFFFGWFNGIATLIILLVSTLALVWIIKE